MATRKQAEDKVERKANESVDVVMDVENAPASHSVILATGMVVFVNGSANVSPSVAEVLKQLGIIK